MLVTKYPRLSEQTFTKHFFEMFHQDLDPYDVGHESFNSLLHTLATLKVVQLEYENFILTVKPSKETLKETKVTGAGYDLTDLDFIPVRADNRISLPRDCVLNYNLPAEDLPRGIKEGQTFPVVITQVESPSKFWFNMQQYGHLDQVKTIMEKMDDLYNGISGDKFRIGNVEILRPGNVLAAKYKDEGYHRVMVINVVDCSLVKLFYVDYGTVENQKLSKCRFLHHDFTVLPGQAIEARLWGVKPFGGGKGWDGNKARDKLVELTDTLEGSLVAQVMAGVNRKEVTIKGGDKLQEARGLALSLLDIFVGDNGLDIANELVREGIADWDVQEEIVLENDVGADVCEIVKYPENGVDTSELVKVEKSKIVARDDQVPESNTHSLSPYLQLLLLHEQNLRRMEKVLKDGKMGGKEERKQKAKVWALGRCLDDISRKREDVEKQGHCNDRNLVEENVD